MNSFGKILRLSSRYMAVPIWLNAKSMIIHLVLVNSSDWFTSVFSW